MRLLLGILLLLLHSTLTLTISFGSIGEVAGEGAADAGAAGKGAAGDGATEPKSVNQGTNDDDSSPGNSIETGCTVYSCPNGNANPAPNDSGGTDDDPHEAAEIIEHIGDVLDAITSIVLFPSSDSSSTYTITSKPPLPTAAHPCLSAQSIYSACGSIYGANFTSQPVSQQASCFCYQAFSGGGDNRTTTWVPGLFDGYVSLCDAYIATQTVVSVVSVSASVTVTGAGASAGATGICASVGDVRAGESVSMSASASSTSSTKPGSSAPTTKTTPSSTSSSTTASTAPAIAVAPSTGGGVAVGPWSEMGMGMGIGGYCRRLLVFIMMGFMII